VEWKGPGDPVTEADRAAGRHITASLQQSFPADAIVNEEEGEPPRWRQNPRVWFVDPMDGTREFVARRGEFAVMVGLIVEGEPVVGVVYQPTRDKMYYAARRYGAYLNEGGAETRLTLPDVSDPSALVLAVSRSRPSRLAESVRRQLKIPRSLACGGLGLKIGLLVEGQAHAYIQEGPVGLWDACAPEVILREAGGAFTDLAGLSHDYFAEGLRARGVVAASVGLHRKILETLAGR
jgi:3'(2'), 5'-bisphosphate nucleotidase